MKPAQKKGFTLSLPKGFTLIELLVVIAIVGVLAAVVLLAINPARRLAQARDSGRKSDLSQLATAAQAFFTTNGRYPTTLGELTASGDIKQLPKNPGGCTGDFAIATNATASEAAISVCLEAPTSSGYPPTVTWYWEWRSVTGSAKEVTALQGP